MEDSTVEPILHTSDDCEMENDDLDDDIAVPKIKLVETLLKGGHTFGVRDWPGGDYSCGRVYTPAEKAVLKAYDAEVEIRHRKTEFAKKSVKSDGGEDIPRGSAVKLCRRNDKPKVEPCDSGMSLAEAVEELKLFIRQGIASAFGSGNASEPSSSGKNKSIPVSTGKKSTKSLSLGKTPSKPAVCLEKSSRTLRPKHDVQTPSVDCTQSFEKDTLPLSDLDNSRAEFDKVFEDYGCTSDILRDVQIDVDKRSQYYQEGDSSKRNVEVEEPEGGEGDYSKGHIEVEETEVEEVHRDELYTDPSPVVGDGNVTVQEVEDAQNQLVVVHSAEGVLSTILVHESIDVQVDYPIHVVVNNVHLHIPPHVLSVSVHHQPFLPIPINLGKFGTDQNTCVESLGISSDNGPVVVFQSGGVPEPLVGADYGVTNSTTEPAEGIGKDNGEDGVSGGEQSQDVQVVVPTQKRVLTRRRGSRVCHPTSKVKSRGPTTITPGLEYNPLCKPKFGDLSCDFSSIMWSGGGCKLFYHSR